MIVDITFTHEAHHIESNQMATPFYIEQFLFLKKDLML